MRVLRLPRAGLSSIAIGAAGGLVLLMLLSRPGAAEKQLDPECFNHKDSLCRMVESCTPKGFEANGTCRWSYSVSRSYWKY